MKIDFENWLDNQSYIQEDHRRIFDDAILCYKNGIIRPALMLSYVAFLNIIKHRLQNAQAPTPLPPNKWPTLQRELIDDYKWEATVTTALLSQQQKDSTGAVTKAAIFNISDDIREQIKYWRGRRNDCAHYKRNDITDSHILAFWAFLKSNLPLITVEGGYTSLVNKFANYFDPSVTPPGTDIKPLLEEIPNVVSDDKFIDFFKDAIINHAIDKEIIVYKIVHEAPAIVQDFMKQLLIKQLVLLRQYLAEYPAEVGNIPWPDKKSIRQYWHREIIDHRQNALSIYAEMLNAGLIPTEEIEEANKFILHYCYNDYIGINGISGHQVQTLKLHNFYDLFISEYVTESHFRQHYTTANSHAGFYQSMIWNFKLNEELVRLLCDYFKPGINYPFTVKVYLHNMFERDEEINTQFIEIANTHGWEIPNNLLA